MKIGIMGGTFDPIHMGHLILAEEAYEQLGLDCVWFMPNGSPPHKPERAGGASDWQRLAMTRLAVEDNPHFSVCDIEMESEGVHYSYHTLEMLRERYPGDEFHFIIGADSLFTFESWKEPERICRACILSAGVRDHASFEQMEKQAEVLRRTYQARIELLRTWNVDISSSDIREKMQKRQSVRYYVPEEVRKYILENRIYL